MAKVKETWLRFPPSDSIDVITNKIYIEESPTNITYDSQSFDIGNNIVDELVEVNLGLIEGMTTMDGVYNVGVTALDDRGNESSFTLMNDVPLDFLAPNPVGLLSISDI